MANVAFLTTMAKYNPGDDVGGYFETSARRLAIVWTIHFLDGDGVINQAAGLGRCVPTRRRMHVCSFYHRSKFKELGSKSMGVDKHG